MVDFQIPKSTDLPLLTATLSDEVGPINLTGATIKFQMRLPGSSVLKVDSAAVIVGSAVNGQVSYTWTIQDTNTIGLYIGWFLATFGSTDTLIAPNPPLVIEVTRGPG